jgi:hypothetical protein
MTQGSVADQNQLHIFINFCPIQTSKIAEWCSYCPLSALVSYPDRHEKETKTEPNSPTPKSFISPPLLVQFRREKLENGFLVNPDRAVASDYSKMIAGWYVQYQKAPVSVGRISTVDLHHSKQGSIMRDSPL